MEREEFARRLKVAATRVLALTRTYVIDHLPDEVMFAPAMGSWVEHVPLGPGEVVFAADDGRFPATPRRRCTPGEMVELLWRDGRVPRWIDLVVVDVEDGRTLIEAEVSPRFTDDPNIVDEPRAEDRPFLIKARNSPPWIARTPQLGPLARFPLRWRDDPEAARQVRDPETVSLRRLQLRRMLAGSRTREVFQGVLSILRSRPTHEMPWRDPAEVIEAIDDAERGLADWDDAVRESVIDHAFLGDMIVHPWARLMRHVVVSRPEERWWMLRALLESPWMVDLVGLEIRRSEVDLGHLARSLHVRKLRRLVIHDTSVAGDKVTALAASANLQGLSHLTLSRLHLPPAWLAQWLDGTPGRSLRELVLAGIAGEGHLEVLLARPELLERLEVLGMPESFLGESQVLKLAGCGALAKLRLLDLRGSTPISADLAGALRAAPQFARTQVLL